MPSCPLPASVRVGYRTYVIERWAHREAASAGCLGECSNHAGRIRIDEEIIGCEPVKAANTLLHEVLHACWYIGRLDDDDKEERVVGVLANQLTQVLADNPELVSFLQANMAAPK